MATAWRTRPQAPDAAARLAEAAGLPRAAAQALLNRGIRTADAADAFLRPRLSALDDPFALPGMAPACARLARAARDGERVAVFGDYDVDGVAATALLSAVLGRLGARVRPFLPHRLDDGYGLQVGSIERCLEAAPTDVVVTVDCGAKAHAAAAAARRRGVDLVITDHHPPGDDPPDAAAVVNPHYADEAPWRHLAGVGVAFKLAHALVKAARDAGRPGAEALDLRPYLEWVALGTVADVAPLAGENRTLTRFGLARMAEAPSVGVRALLDVAGVAGPPQAWHVGFALAPRLNAAGRMGTPEEALALLQCADPDEARRRAQRLDTLNRQRQRAENRVLGEALDQALEADPAGGLVAAGPWHPGVVGIVAARLCQRRHQPAVVIALRPDGGGRGSGRAPEGFDLAGALAACAPHLERFGGHAAAAGVELKPGRLDAFRADFEAVCRELRADEPPPALDVDAWLALDEADEALLGALDAMAPFGAANAAPRWASRRVRVVESRIVGADHRRLRLADGAVERAAIGFGMAARGDPSPWIDVLYEAQRNTWRGRTNIQLRLLDFRPAEETD